MSTESSNGKMSSMFVAIVIPMALIVSIIFYMFVLGDSSNFEGGDPVKGHPIEAEPGHTFGLIHKGGFIVPILITVNLLVIIFSIERFLTLSRAKGKGRIEGFLGNVRQMLAGDQVDQAIAECDAQQGSVANVMRSGLEKYKTVLYDASHDKEMRLQAVKQELEK